MYTVSYTGMDKSSVEVSCGSLKEVTELRTFVEECGGHSITAIEDETGEEV